MGKVYDCCMFFNELDMLETRFHILSPVVDYFVVCESSETHSGLPKPLYFWDSVLRGGGTGFRDRIIYVNAGPLSDGKRNSWERERYQRSKIAEGLYSALPDDLVIVGDADEIPNPDVIAELQRTNADGAMLEMATYYYSLRYRTPEGWAIGAMRWKFEHEPNKIRTGAGHDFPHIDNAGWHFSYWGGAQAIVNKVNAFMHSDDPIIRDMPRDREWVAETVAQGRDLFNRPGFTLTERTSDDKLPQYILDNPEKYRAWFE